MIWSRAIVALNTCVCTHSGVYLSLGGMVYANNDAIPITEIGTTANTALQCITDRMPCCAAAAAEDRLGAWLFPNGMSIPRQGLSATFYRTRGDDGTVNLNRDNTNVMMPTGQFCCEVPDALNVMQRLCANIGELEMNCNFISK